LHSLCKDICGHFSCTVKNAKKTFIEEVKLSSEVSKQYLRELKEKARKLIFFFFFLLTRWRKNICFNFLSIGPIILTSFCFRRKKKKKKKKSFFFSTNSDSQITDISEGQFDQTVYVYALTLMISVLWEQGIYENPLAYPEIHCQLRKYPDN